MSGGGEGAGGRQRIHRLFGFLHQQRHVLFDDAFQDALAGMYRETGAGDEPLPPAMMCMALLLQGYVGVSDAEAVECSVVDLRWQMVLGCLGTTAPAFSPRALQAFRERLIAHEMDRALLERTVALVRTLPDGPRSTNWWAFNAVSRSRKSAEKRCVIRASDLLEAQRPRERQAFHRVHPSPFFEIIGLDGRVNVVAAIDPRRPRGLPPPPACLRFVLHARQA